MTTEQPMMTLRVTRNEAIADGINLFEFRQPDGAALPEFSAGAHIAIRVPNGAIRKYSLCNDPAERGHYQIAVKREASGRGGSIDLIDNVKAGDTVMVSEPVNDFALPPRATDFLFIAGGIGITPILAMIRQVQAAGKHFRLYYCSRSPETTAFKEELGAPGIREFVTIHYDNGDPSCSLDLRPILKERQNREHLYCCGPRPLMEAVRAMTDHWSPTAVHFEAFSDAETHKAGDRPFRVKLAKTGKTVDVPADKTILEVLRETGLEVPSSCETGTCGTCRTRYSNGEADHRDLVLAEHEKADTIMICVSRAKSDEITLDR
ncbi:PDR/VanB family oxidoreductase [Pseudolabrys sp. Root1462]|uniref:PDR/VanB family oxidoreductase n=1 Tax=Pseudolabrys sp. Root1462 TaxID=1736466 RepID=UPI000B1F7680|nr:PDR/VanB family oxidoreductase [Pseudolabrys sp. Root1462]